MGIGYHCAGRLRGRGRGGRVRGDDGEWKGLTDAGGTGEPEPEDGELGALAWWVALARDLRVWASVSCTT